MFPEFKSELLCSLSRISRYTVECLEFKTYFRLDFIFVKSDNHGKLVYSSTVLNVRLFLVFTSAPFYVLL